MADRGRAGAPSIEGPSGEELARVFAVLLGTVGVGALVLLGFVATGAFDDDSRDGESKPPASVGAATFGQPLFESAEYDLSIAIAPELIPVRPGEATDGVQPIDPRGANPFSRR